MERTHLQARTRGRNQSIWTNYDLDGFTANLDSLEDLANQLSGDSIEQYINIVDETYIYQTDMAVALHDLEIKGVEQDTQIAYDRYVTHIQAMTLKQTGEQYVLAARYYEQQVQSLIWDAKEYAAAVDRERIALQRDQAIMDITKAEAHLLEVNAAIQLQIYERAQTEVDVAKAQLDVAKANVRVVMAGVEVEQTELKVIQAQLEEAMTEAEKATLQADVAQIYADIIVKGLTKIKFDVESSEIANQFLFIQRKLDDMLAIWADRTLIEQIKLDYQAYFQAALAEMTVAQKALEDLRIDQLNAKWDVWSAEEGVAETYKDLEYLLRADAFSWKEDLLETHSTWNINLDNRDAWAKALVNLATRATYAGSLVNEISSTILGERILKGDYYVTVAGAGGVHMPACGGGEEGGGGGGMYG